MPTQINSKVYLCKYQVQSLVLMMGAEKIIMNASNILSIEYLCDYEFNIRAIIKISLRVDIRKKLWILKNRANIICKFELGKIGIDPDLEEYVTSPETVWNQEFGIYFNDEEDSTDVRALEERIKLNEGDDFLTSDISSENYFESQNMIDIYLFNKKLLNASNTLYNDIITKNTLQQIVGRLLTATHHSKVLMSRIENDEVYNELLIPANPAYKDLIYLDQYYGLYKTGAMIFYDVDVLYILNTNGKLTAKRTNEWPETTILVSNLDISTPGNGMFRNPGEKTFYISLSNDNVNPQRISTGKSGSLGSEAKMVITDDVTINVSEATQSDMDQRNDFIIYSRKDDNKYSMNIAKARMAENDAILYIDGENLDINAFTPNKVFQVVFSETLKQQKYGKYKYRLAYAYHYLRIESESYMSSAHQFILKRCASDEV